VTAWAHGLICLVSDYETLDGLTGLGEVGADVPDVAGGLADVGPSEAAVPEDGAGAPLPH
jgi:hypothetical protein